MSSDCGCHKYVETLTLTLRFKRSIPISITALCTKITYPDRPGTVLVQGWRVWVWSWPSGKTFLARTLKFLKINDLEIDRSCDQCSRCSGLNLQSFCLAQLCCRTDIRTILSKKCSNNNPWITWPFKLHFRWITSVVSNSYAVFYRLQIKLPGL